MCTDRHGIFNYLRIQSEFRAPCRALCSRLLLFRSSSIRRAVFGRFLSFFSPCPSCLAHLFSLRALRTFQEASRCRLSAHSALQKRTRRFACRSAARASRALCRSCRRDCNDTVRTLDDAHRPDKKRLTGAVLPSVRQSTSEFFSALSLQFVSLRFLLWLATQR